MKKRVIEKELIDKLKRQRDIMSSEICLTEYSNAVCNFFMDFFKETPEMEFERMHLN